MKRENSFTSGPILGPLVRFALPVLLALFLQALYGAIDLWVVGKFAEAADVSGVSTGSQITQTVAIVITGLAMGITVQVGQKIGEGRPDEAGRAIGSGITLFLLLALAVTAVILTVALSQLEFTAGKIRFGFSTLLVCMMLATVFCNICDFSPEIMERTDRWTYPLFILFFVISGSELDLSVFADLTVVLIGLVYIIFRSLGKYFGAGISAGFMKCDPAVKHNLGLTLLPQAGVALGMANSVGALGEEGGLIRNIVLFGVLIYEIVGPSLTRFALTRAGDIESKPEGKTARRLPENTEAGEKH